MIPDEPVKIFYEKDGSWLEALPKSKHFGYLSHATENVESTRSSPRSASATARSLKSRVDEIQNGT